MRSNNFTSGHLLKIEWLVTDVTAVGSPDRAECDILGMTLGVLSQLVQAAFLVGGPFCDLGIPF